MRVSGVVCGGLLWVSGAVAQNPADLSVTLAAKEGRTQFRMGEAVEVELRFQSSTPGRYRVWTGSTKREVRVARFDRFIAEPPAGVADPLADIFAQHDGGAIRGIPPAPAALGGGSMVVELRVNDWLSFRQAGRYRIKVETTRVVTAGQPPATVPLASSAIEIEMVEAEPGWAAAQLQGAVAVLERGDLPQPRIGETFDMAERLARDEEMAQAARTLRYLETREAAPALARFFENGPQAAQGSLRAGLFATSYRKEAMAAMEAAVLDRDFPVTYYYLATLMELAMLSRLGPTPLYIEGDAEAQKRWMEQERPYHERAKPIEAEHFAKLAEAVGRKRGKALAVSLETVVSRGPQPAPPAVVKALTENFGALPEMSQMMLLNTEWPKLASPEIEPFLRAMAEGSGPARDMALQRLAELNPGEARKIAVERIRRGDVVMGGPAGNPGALAAIADGPLPELDGPLAELLEQGKPVELFVARFGSEAIFARVRAFAETHGACGGHLLAYFFRVDPAYAGDFLARARKESPGSCSLNLSPYEDLLTSPALEAAAIADLANPGLARAAQMVLQRGGSAGAEQPLMEAMMRQRGSGTGPMEQGNETGFVYALLGAARWTPGPEQVDRVMAACATDNCRREVASMRRGLEAPVSIPPYGDWRVGTVQLRDRAQLERKIAQFPKGTAFYFERGYEGTWLREQRMRDLRRVLEAAGLKEVDPPALPR